MKKIVRLTESDLTRIVKRVISEQQSGQNKNDNNKTLETFLNKIDTTVRGDFYSYWVLDPNNPKKRSGNVILTGRERMVFNNLFKNKPLVWSLMVDGKKVKNSLFEIFKFNEKLYYSCLINNGYNVVSEYFKELEPNLSSAINVFNQNVSMQNTK